MFRFHQGLDLFLETQAPQIVQQIPVLVILDGRAIADGPQPLCIQYPNSEHCMAIIDTSDLLSEKPLINAPLLITSREIIYQRNEFETRSYSFAGIDNFVVDQNRIQGWIEFCRNWLALALYPLVLLSLFVYRSFQAIFYAVIGLLMTKYRRLSIAFPNLASLSAVALTPAILLQGLAILLGVSQSIPAPTYLLISLAYLWFALSAQISTPGNQVDIS